MVVDTSVILAVYFDDARASWAVEQLNRNARALRMSTVNLTESLIRIRDRQPTLAQELEHRLLTSGIRFVPPDESQAVIAAEARLRFPLNLGDCFAYALARVEQCPILTLDEDFKNLDVSVVIP
ncbi:MAG: type II toxin-antitoxin system VapC family toxin [Tepidisphaeraceae bacterium]